MSTAAFVSKNNDWRNVLVKSEGEKMVDESCWEMLQRGIESSNDWVIADSIDHVRNEVELFLKSRVPPGSQLEEDLAQETIIVVLNYRGTWSNFRAWVLECAKNKWRDWIRRKTNHQLTLELNGQSDAGVTISEPLVELEEDLNEEKELVVRYLGQLSEVERQVIVLHYFEGLDMQAISVLIKEDHIYLYQIRSRAVGRLKDLIHHRENALRGG